MTGALVDAAGLAHERAADDARIVSLVPSLTELVCDLGLGDRLVGRTGFCIHPRETLRAVPKVGGTKDVDLAKLEALAPTHVIVNVDENRREDAEAIARIVPHVIVTHPLAPDDNPGLYRLFGGIFGREDEAQMLSARYAEARERALDGVMPNAARVLYLIWREPWMSISRDTYISRMLGMFGWDTLPAESAERYPEVDLAALGRDVDRVLLSTEPFPFRETHLAEAAAISGRPAELIDGEMVSWYGSRAIRGLDYLAAFTRRDARDRRAAG
ncbi:MAG: ABC transporter substrate-binding protein [Gammaproteobacteria bacterium]|nr:ABC transporter substrate-binding protein [Gammaproteobacteria bacterium]